MFNITITAYSLQNTVLTLSDGTKAQMQVYFRPMQQGWFINNLTYGTFILNGLRITNSPNMLLQFQNQIPFGIACFSIGNREPGLLQDFSSGASKLYLLTQAECRSFYHYLQTGVF